MLKTGGSSDSISGGSGSGSCLDSNGIPVIDFSQVLQHPESIAKEIFQCCQQVGFFYAIGHSLPQDLIDKIFQHSEHLFHLPIQIKQTANWQDDNRGYVGLQRERLDPSKAAWDLKEAFNIGPSGNRWPEGTSQEFRSDLQNFYEECLKVSCSILSSYACALNMDKNFFEEGHRDQSKPSGTTLRLLHYPPIEQPTNSNLRAGSHSDYGSITLLFQKDIGGLEVLSKSGQWIPVPPREGAIVVNTGDLMQRWTSDEFCSTVHRVCINPSTTKSRYSIAFFLHPHDDYIVHSLSGEKYPAISSGQYLKQKLQASY